MSVEDSKMNIVTEEKAYTESTPGENKNPETKNQPQPVHIIFQDLFSADQHIWLFATHEAEMDEDSGKKAKARKIFEDKVKTKAQNYLNRKNANMATVKILTQAEWEQSQEAGKTYFYVLYQNGTRRFVSIRAENKTKAGEIFNQRISETWPKMVFTSEEFKTLREKGGWKTFILPAISHN
jgi:hypothetical protein